MPTLPPNMYILMPTLPPYVYSAPAPLNSSPAQSCGQMKGRALEVWSRMTAQHLTTGRLMASHSSSAASFSSGVQISTSLFVLFLCKILEGGGRKGSGRERVCLKEAQWSLKPVKQWQKSAKTGISWNTQNQQGRKACTTVWAAQALKRRSSYAKISNVTGTHWFQISPETITKKITVDGWWWMAEEWHWQSSGSKDSRSSPFPVHPLFANLGSATACEANPFTSLSVSTHSKDALSLLLRRHSSEARPSDLRSHVLTALNASVLPLQHVCRVCFRTPL